LKREEGTAVKFFHHANTAGANTVEVRTDTVDTTTIPCDKAHVLDWDWNDVGGLPLYYIYEEGPLSWELVAR